MGTGVLSPGLKRNGCYVDHSPLSRAEVKNEWGCTSTPAFSFMVWTGATLPLHLPPYHGFFNVVTPPALVIGIEWGLCFLMWK